MNLVFLDIDGVLNNTNDWICHRIESNDILIEYISYNNIYFFMNAIREIENVKIVISSSWRMKGYEKFKECILSCSKEYGEELLSYLHKDWKTPKKMSSTRGEEVTFWLNDHYFNEIDKYICLDDDSNYGYNKIHPLLLISNDYGFGFRESKIMLDYFGLYNAGSEIREMGYLMKVLEKQEEFFNDFSGRRI